jgi:hypothetical protein
MDIHRLAAIALAFGAAIGARAQQPAPQQVDPAPKPVAVAPEIARLGAEVRTERLMETIRALPTARSGWGDEAHWQGLLDAEALVIERFEALGLTPQSQEIPWPARRTRFVSPEREEGISEDDLQERPRFRNIWVDLPGDAKPQEVLLLSAHLDAVRGSPGADDDGTGVAAILELARVLEDQPRARTLRLMVFNLEEPGLIGSRHYVAARLDREQETVIGMASLDMLGYFSDEPGSQRSPIRAIEGVFEPPTVGDFIAMGGVLRHREFSQRLGGLMVAGAPDLKVMVADFLPFAPPDMLRSDHAPFLAAGVPAVIISDTANFRSEHYHTASDRAETLDWKRFTLVVRALAVAAAQMTAAGADGAE